METRRRRKKPDVEEDKSILPYEVICNILSRLPAKTLLRFRCVCKLWRTLISEHHFIKSHFTEAVRSDRRRILCSLYGSDHFISIDCGGGTPGEFKEEKLFFPIKKYRNRHVLSSCNGLVVLGRLCMEGIPVLWNLSTNAYIKLPCPSNFELVRLCGLCYDSLIDDYKLILVNLDDTVLQHYYVVYTFRSNSWTEAKKFNYWVHHPNFGVSVNGAPHWIMTSGGFGRMRRPRRVSMDPCLDLLLDNDDQNLRPYLYDPNADDVIIYFDSVDNDFKEVPPPYWMQKGYIFRLMVIRERLGLYIYTGDHKLVEVWAMMEYGVRDSWTKLFSIPREGRPQGITPLTVTKKGEVVVYRRCYNHGLNLYDPEENKWTNIRTNPYGSVQTFVDSLNLPIRDTLTKKQQHRKRQTKGKGKGKGKKS